MTYSSVFNEGYYAKLFSPDIVSLNCSAIKISKCPSIKDVNILVKDKVVEVIFTDGTKQKAVCDEHDKFDLETEISICITKHLLGGTKEYNDAVRAGVKVHNDKLKKIEEEKKLKELIARKKAKRLAKKQKQAEKKREEAIAIQTEAYIRAMKAMNENSLDDLK